MSISYPSVVVNLRLRFDETFQVVDLPEPLPQSGSIDAVSDDVGPVTRPLITRVGNDNLSHILNRIPKSASFTLPGFRQAATFQLVFDYRELPIDPRLLRAIGVEIFQGVVKENDFATGMVQIEPDGTRRSILNVFQEDGQVNDDLLLMAGVVDTWKMTHTDSNSIIEMEGRDLRGIFLDSPLNIAIFRSIDLRKPIHEVISSIIETHPAGEDMNVVTYEEEWPNAFIPSVADKDGLTRPRRKANGSGSNASSPTSSPTYWDMITQMSSLVGGVPYFEGRDLVIRPARGVFSQINNENGDSPFRKPGTNTSIARIDNEGKPFYVRRMIHGRNIKSLSFERKYTGTKVPVIEVVSLDTSGQSRGPGKLLIQRWPPQDKKLAQISGVSPSGEVAQTDVLRINKPGIRDPDKLLEIAKDLYEEIGRQEIGGACETKSVASFGLMVDNDDPDLLRLKPGHAVEFLVDTSALRPNSPIASQFTDFNRSSFDEAVSNIKKDLLAKSGSADENLIRVLVASSRSQIIDLLRYFRVSNVVYNWNNGIVAINFDFQNYIVARSAITPQTTSKAKSTKKIKKVRRKVRTKTPRPTPQLDGIKPSAKRSPTQVVNDFRKLIRR